ncbi:hypothetical protein [Blastomonas sp.]|uniref:hypothetical protein n=1 Tax=Blastomonas sp. TaxID=1909299 RepID=UPI00261869C0|nr:hypothetical protein [Blastomonas sp.]MDM7955804.1 hypothetical protein [Blastomonas sp.]
MTNAIEKRFEAARYNSTFVKPVAPETIWDRRISNHVAYALLAYTGLQIFVVMGAVKGEDMSILPYLGLVALVAIVIPMCRRVEKRWQTLSRGDLPEARLMALYRGDRLGIWLFAIGFPFAFVAVVKGLSALF